MNTLWLRIKKRYELTKKNWESDCAFSVKLAWLRLTCDFSKRLHMKRLGRMMEGKKDEWIRTYLYNELGGVLEKYSKDTYRGEYQQNAPIWICWWTGEGTAPALVKQCIKSIRESAGTHPIHMITEENYQTYVDIPSFILNKVQNGQMCVAHCADYVRVSLLEKYGGIWLDATIYCTNKLREEYFSQSIFTAKGPCEPNGYLAQGKWTTFCLGGWPGHTFYRCIKELFERYWEKHEIAIDYLFFDYLIEMIYLRLNIVRECFDTLPNNNIHRDALQAAMNEALPAEQFYDVIKDNTILYKLSWREQYSEITDDGRESIYKYFLTM